MASLKTQPEFEAMTEFEEMIETETETEIMEKEMTTNNDSAVALAVPSTAITKAATGAVATAGKFKIAYSEFYNVFDTATVEGLAMATPRVKAEQGSLFKGEEDLGSAIRIELISFNHRYTIATGETDTESKEFFRISYDGVRTTQGELVTDYIASLKAQGFDKTKMSPYMDIFGLLVWSEKKGDVTPELVCLQASKIAMSIFTGFCTTQGLLVSKGMAKQSDLIEVRAEKRTSGSNKYTTMTFHRP